MSVSKKIGKWVKLGKLIELSEDRNDNLIYSLDDVRGISILKKLIPTKADMKDVSLYPYKLLKPKEFCYVSVTSRNGNNNFEYGKLVETNGLKVNQRCKELAMEIKRTIDKQSSYTDWLNNSQVRADLNQQIFFCLRRHGYPPQYDDEVFDKVMDQVEHFKQKSPSSIENDNSTALPHSPALLPQHKGGMSRPDGDRHSRGRGAMDGCNRLSVESGPLHVCSEGNGQQYAAQDK